MEGHTALVSQYVNLWDPFELKKVHK